MQRSKHTITQRVLTYRNAISKSFDIDDENPEQSRAHLAMQKHIYDILCACAYTHIMYIQAKINNSGT